MLAFIFIVLLLERMEDIYGGLKMQLFCSSVLMDGNVLSTLMFRSSKSCWCPKHMADWATDLCPREVKSYCWCSQTERASIQSW